MIRKKLKSIQSSIFLAFSSFFIVLVIGTGFISYSLTEDVAKKIAINNTYLLVDQAYRNILFYMQYMKHISSIVHENKDIQDYLTNFDNFSVAEKKEYKGKIINLLKSIQETRTDINLIMIFGTKGEVISNRDKTPKKKYIDYTKQDWFINAKAAKGKPVISPSHIQNFFDNEYRWVVSLSREIRPVNSNNLVGTLLVDLNFNIIEDICNSMHQGKNGYFFIIDKSGRIIYHPQQQLIYSEIKTEMIDRVLQTVDGSFIVSINGLDEIYTVKTSTDPDWKIVGVTYLNELISNKTKIQIYYVFLSLISILIIIIISILLSTRISKPIKRLRQSMKDVENGNFEITVIEKSQNEIGELEKDFNIMICKIKELMEQIVHEQEQKRMNELKALQAQINPHFLYNTLESIIWLAANKKSDEVLNMTSALAKLFRIGISKGEEFITIKDEIEHIKSYLIIQKMRYKDKLDYSIEIDPSIIKMKTIKLILQPMVENAIYHGIKNKIEPGHISIIAKKRNKNIIFQIIDDGVGMSPEQVKVIFESHDFKSDSSGVGVQNVRDRIRLYFGKDYGLKCIKSNSKGTTIELCVPQIKENKL